MNNTELIKVIISASGSIIGAIIGAIVAVVAIWAKEFLEARKASQSWFEETYITGGIDHLLGYLRLQDVMLTLLLSARQTIEIESGIIFPSVERIPINEALNTFPIESLVRVETLLNTQKYTAIISTLPEFTRFYNNVEPEKRSQAMLSEKIGLIRQAYNSLLKVRGELLSVKVRRKSDVHNIHKNKLVQNSLKDLAAEFLKYQERTPERDRLVSKGL